MTRSVVVLARGYRIALRGGRSCVIALYGCPACGARHLARTRRDQPALLRRTACGRVRVELRVAQRDATRVDERSSR